MAKDLNKKTAVNKMMKKMDKRSEANFGKLETTTIIAASTKELTQTMTKDTKTKNKTNNMKLLLKMDLKPSFQEKAHKVIAAYFEKTLPAAIRTSAMRTMY